MDILNLTEKEQKELQELYQLKQEGRVKIKGEQKSREELLAYNHYRQNRLNHYINAMFNCIKENQLIDEVEKFSKSENHYLEMVKTALEKNPDAKISKGKKSQLPAFSVFEKSQDFMPEHKE